MFEHGVVTMRRLTQKETELVKQAIKFTDPCIMCHANDNCDNCTPKMQYVRMVGTCAKMNLLEYVQTIQNLQATQKEIIRKVQCLPAEIRGFVKMN